MAYKETRPWKKSIQALSQVLVKGVVDLGAIKLLHPALESICKVLECSSGPEEDARRGESILASTLKCCLTESFVHLMGSLVPPHDVKVLYPAIYGCTEIFSTILEEAPQSEAKSKFVSLLVETSFVEILARTLLSFKGHKITHTLISIKPALYKLVKVCCRVFLDAKAKGIQHNSNRLLSHAVQETYKNLLLCVCSYIKLMLHSHPTRIALSSTCMPVIDGTSTSREVFIQQHLLQLHRHLLRVVKGLERAFESLPVWKYMRDFLLEEDLLSIIVPEDRSGLGPKTSGHAWGRLHEAVNLLEDILRLQYIPHPVQEVVANMSLELMLALGPSGFRSSVILSRVLGQNLLRRTWKDVHSEENARLTVRVLFAAQLNLEAMCALYNSGQSDDSLWVREFDTSASFSLRDQGKKKFATENEQFTKEIFAMINALYGVWMLQVEEQFGFGVVAPEVRQATLQAMHEEGIEVLLERQIRWVCSPQARWLPFIYRATCLRRATKLLLVLIKDGPRICIGCHVSLIVTIGKVALQFLADFRDASTEQEVFNYHEALEAMFMALAIWVDISVVVSSLSVLIGNTRELGSGPEFEPLPAVRYVARSELSPAECATLLQHALPTCMQLILSHSVMATSRISVDSSRYTLSSLIVNLHRMNQTASREARGWFVSTILSFSCIPLLKKMYFGSPAETCSSALIGKKLDLPAEKLCFAIAVMSIALSCASGPVIHDFARQIVWSGMLEDLHGVLSEAKPDCGTQGTFQFPFHSVEVMKTSNMRVWAMTWISFLKALLELTELLHCTPDPAVRSVYQMYGQQWCYLPHLAMQGADREDWVVLRDHETKPHIGSSASQGDSATYWFAKPTETGEVKNSCIIFPVIPSVSLAKDFICSIQNAAAGLPDKDSALSKGVIEFPKGTISVLHVGCWSPGCQNLSGPNEASLCTKLCGGCRTARYCSRSCQRDDWLRHREECKQCMKELQGDAAR